MAVDYRKLAVAAARRYGIDPRLFTQLVQAESGFNPGARSPAGAQGLTQLMPGTARGLGVRDPYDPMQNLDGGARYLSQQLKAFGGDPRKALAAYNAGPGAVTKYGGIPPYRETQNYVAKIMSSMGADSSLSAPPPGAAVTSSPTASPGAPSFDIRDVLRQAISQGGSKGLSSRLPSLLIAARQQAEAMQQAPQAVGDAVAQATGDVAQGFEGGLLNVGGGPRDHGARALGNWQSDQAYDLMGAAGQSISLPFDSQILKVSGGPGGNPQFAGYGVTASVPGGNLFLKHLGSLGAGVKPGARLRSGMRIGTLDPSTRGGPHLHGAADNPALLEQLRRALGRA